ncbi:Nucleotidyl transferase family protein, related [Neospora caninum Liverpool]|uniref:mannose-1-phosphate guanylyltransferase n=1 Tax=Neospora caninum (strain Liverpool) TaxID=572307 RepID=F0VH57_NEOCL|nr:Nucleotidyl transferase family protein, related [Neospora caninum Liverpool]CBZ53051.1 Nucleotidyl transferase family protein, related [Neospora caninum Liverpool]CEL67035.1 TPA: Nucleotidyl transferase family protein, related [Neospora caninum Liverpool]|eukprot:XP_003883083.1 Nucleotidyl transferase family protein, related [Neospora caninum Liverpool]
MKALVLVGGYGTRLRPLTLSVPKPLINFCNKSIVEYQIHRLLSLQAGVDHVILAVAYQPSTLMDALSALEQKYSLAITCSREDEPLGTAGPIRLARDLLLSPPPALPRPDGDGEAATAVRESPARESASGQAAAAEPAAAHAGACTSEEVADTEDCFFVCNSDVICPFPFKEMLAFHKATGAEGTILVTEVENPSIYGVVLHDEEGRVSDFIEKPQQFVGRCINAGLYILNTSVIDRIQLRPTSIEKEVFPQMAREKKLFCFKLDGYWADIGQPKDFLQGMSLHLDAMRQHQEAASREESENGDDLAEAPSSSRLVSGPQFIGNVLVDPSAKIGDDCLIGPDVTIDRGVVVGRGCRLQRSALMEGVRVGDYTWMETAIVGWQSRIGKWCRIEGLTVVGEDVHIRSECCINGAFVLPHKSITQSIREPGSIIM